MNKAKRLILAQSWVATIGSLYYGWYGDPVKNATTGDWFNIFNGFVPCEMCWFARILMYPILILIIVYFWNKDKKVVDYILPLSGIGILLEGYQYYFQMSNTAETVKSVICGTTGGVNCAATDVMYGGFITIPLLCLISFIVIFVAARAWKRSTTR